MVQKSSDVSLSYSMARLLPKNSDAQLDYNYFVEKFGIKDNVMIIGVKSDDFFDFDNFFLPLVKKLHSDCFFSFKNNFINEGTGD